MLSEGHQSFTHMYETLEISSSHLNYHLEALGELVAKNNGSYKLSVFGKAAVVMMNNIEKPPIKEPSVNTHDKLRMISVVLLVSVIIASGLYANQYNLRVAQRNELELVSAEVLSLKGVTDGLAGLPQLFEETYGKSTVAHVSRHELEYLYMLDGNRGVVEHSDAIKDSVMIFYAPMEDMVLRIYLAHFNLPDHISMPITLQKGNALLNESAVVNREGYILGKLYKTWKSEIVWSTESQGGGNVFDVDISEKGWYTLSLTGPVTFSGSDPEVWYMWGEPEQWVGVEGVHATGHCILLKDGKVMFFGLEKNYDHLHASGWSLDDFV